MKIIKEDWQKHAGWWLGNFEPTAYKTEGFEVCHKLHPKGERWPPHYHKIATEINYLLKGRMIIQGQELIRGDVFIIEPMEVADPTFKEDCEVIVVKVPSIQNDKYEV